MPSVSFLFLDQIRDSAWLIEITAHKPSRYDRNILAIEPPPETQEMAVPSSSIRALVAEAFSPMDDRNLEIILMMAHRMAQKNAKRAAAKSRRVGTLWTRVAVAVLFAVLLFRGLWGLVALIGFCWAHLD